ncbi:hypothetical protein [Brevibacillus brevis]|uniref:hypothetical protein n=1 Tax=Brevibacillus brevis TaxID=1393 RepID=UPI0019029FB6|nr:hypothetical protein [Brevibacillus brevis]
MNKFGIIIKKLVLRGSGKEDATLIFDKGLNVVAGASDLASMKKERKDTLSPLHPAIFFPKKLTNSSTPETLSSSPY